MENKQNGRGIFYGVIGVATLVVAIIGATFAFFTATVNTDNEAINVSAAKVSLALNESLTKSHFVPNMIPVDVMNHNKDTKEEDGTTNAYFYDAYPGDNASGPNSCMDDVGNAICSLYQITVENPSGSPAQTVEGYIQVTLNDKFKNLHYAVFSGSIAQLEGTGFNLQDAGEWKTVQATKEGSAGFITHGVIDNSTQTQVDAAVNAETGVMTTQAKLKTNGGWSPWGKASAVRLGAGETATYTILLWLEDTGNNQNDEMLAVMTAGIKFQSAEGSEVTGIITATGPTT